MKGNLAMSRMQDETDPNASRIYAGIDVGKTALDLALYPNAGAHQFENTAAGVSAEFEATLRREGQMEGIVSAIARRFYNGRKSSINPAEIRRLHAEGTELTEIARKLKIGKFRVYRVFGAI